MICACGRANPEDASFCLGCGVAFGLRCGDCGTELPSDARFCLRCGSEVTAEAATPLDPGAAAQPARREVRKVVTVVFVDLAGSTSLQEHMDPESVRRTMDRFYATMRTEIESAGGLVVKFTGDGVMAGFGIREAREDDALCAVRAAAAMQESFAAFAHQVAATRGATVALRIGVNTGEVVVSEEDDDVVGDVVNVAARLEHEAGEGTTIVGEETYRLTRHAVTYEAVEPLELKGKAEPVPAYRVVSLEAPEDEEAVAPFVGRGAELAGIHEVFEASMDSASPAIVTVVGSPGLGKTRLAAEFTAAVSDRATILEARCYAAAGGTYAPLAEALREAAGIPETARSEEVVSALRVLLPEDFPEADRIAKLVASLLGVGQAAAPQETFWATRRLLEGMTAKQPLVLVVDDVQWAEPLLLDLFDHVVEWTKGAAITILALARPEIREVRPSLVDSGAVVLEGLAPEDTSALAASLLGAHDLPVDLVGRILAATEGNPLFVRELLRMLVDDGVLSREGDRWVVNVEAEAIDVPPTIQALLSARIERLRDEERAVVERASVVGKEFYRGAVLELCPPQVGSGLDAHLETLRRKELVEPEGSYWIDERVFRFHHVLIRDAAYRRLLKESRADLHERLADWLERKVGDLVGEHEEVLGYHLEQAHVYRTELGLFDERTHDLGRRAAAHLASATRRALGRDDLTAAANLSGRALALTDDPSVRDEILLDRCEALLGMGQVGSAPAAVGELRVQATDDRLAAWADCFDGQLAILTDPSRLRDTAITVEGAARRLEALGDVAGAAKAHATHAQALAHLGQFGACEAALDRALAAAREAGDRRRANAVLSAAPLAALWGPNPVPRASGRCLDVVRVLRITAGAPAVEATALRCQAVLEAMRGRTVAAHRMLASSRETLEELGLRHALVECDLFGGLIDLFANDLPAAEAAFRAAHDGFRALDVGTDTAQAAALLARTLVEQGEDEEALALTEESERLGGDDLKTAIAWRCVRARVLARRGETAAALDLARAAVALAEPTDALVDHADARLALAEVLRSAGQAEEADAELRKAGELSSRKEATTAHQGPPEAMMLDAADTPSSPDLEEERKGTRAAVRAAPGVEADLSSWKRLHRALLARNLDAIAEEYSPDHVFVDRRSGLRSEARGRAAFLQGSRAMWQQLETGWDLDIEVLAQWSDDLTLTRVRRFGLDWEVSALVLRVRRDDVWVRTEQFDEGDHADAFVRLDELAYETSVAKPTIDRYVSAPNEHGWEEVVPIVTAGSAALVRAGRSLAVVDTAEGEVTVVEIFDPDDELGARMRLYELEPHTSHVRWMAQHYVDANNARDWEEVRRNLEADAEIHDRRPIGWGRVGVDSTIEHLQEAARSTRSFTLEVRDWISLAPDRSAYVLGWSGVTREGADFEYPRIMVANFSPRGSTARATVLEVDQLDEAHRLLSSRAVEVGPVTRGYADLFNAREWDRALETFAPDYFVVDHRPVSLRPRRDLSGFVSDMRELVEGAPNVRVDVEPIFTSPSAEVAILHFRGETREGSSAFAADFVAATRVMDGLGAAAITFDPADADAAVRWATDHAIGFEKEDWARLKESASCGPAGGGLSEFNRRYCELFNSGAGLESLYSPTFEIVEHGHHLRGDLDAHLRVMRAQQAQANSHIRIETTVCLGERHGVCRVTLSWEKQDGSAGPSQVVFWSAARLDHEGRFAYDETFRPEQLHKALARAEELFLEDEATGEAAAGARRRMRAWRICDAVNEQDWDAVREMLAPEFVLIDRRLVGWDRVEGRDAMMEVFRSTGVRSAQHIWRITQVHVLCDDGCVFSQPYEGVDDEGGRYEGDRVVINMFSDEGITRAELFPAEALDEALVRFEELRREATPASPVTVSNAYTRTYRVLHDALSRRDWDAAETLQARDIVLEDRRAGLRDSLAGRDVLLRNQREAIELGYFVGAFEPIATRGDRMALVRWLWIVRDDSEIEMLVVGEMDDQDRMSAWVVFDPDDPDNALAELDARYAATLSPDEAEVFHHLNRLAAAYNARDWNAYTAGFHDDVLVVDHRPAGWGTVHGVDELLVLIRGLVELVPDATVVAGSIEKITAQGSLGVVRLSGTDRNGAEVEILYYSVFSYRDGVIHRDERFPIDEGEAASARFEELTMPTTTAGRTYERLITALGERDAAALADLFAPGYRGRDHRFHMEIDRDQALVDLEVVMTALRSVGPGRVLSFGDRHALGETIWSTSPGAVGESEVSAWYAVRCNADGRYARVEVFPEADMFDAIDRAEELYLEDEATGDEAVASRRRRRFWRCALAYNAGDWDGVRSTLVPDFVTVDHRPGGWGRLEGREAWLETMQGLAGLAQERRWILRSVEFEGPMLLLHIDVTGIDEYGGSFVMPFVVLILVGDDGLERQELWVPEQWDEAERRFRELARAAHVQEPAASTTLSRAWDRLLSAWSDRDVAAVGELVAPDYRAYEHPYHLEMDRDAVLADTERVLSRPGSVRSEGAILLGDRHGLVDMTWTDGQSEVTVWHARRCDVEGRFVVVEVFEAGDMLTALARAEELYLEDEATGEEATWSRDRLERLWRGMLAYNTGDLDGFAAQVPADFVTIDHRPGVVADFETREAWMAWLRTTGEVGRNWRFEVRSVRLERSVVMLDMASIGTDDEGGSVETPLLDVVVPGIRQEMYLPEQREEAERRFHELVAEARSTAATTTIERAWER